MTEQTIDELLIQVMDNERAITDQLVSLDARLKRVEFVLQRDTRGRP